MIHLIEETRKFWRDLDALELAYQQGEIPIEEVDARVAELNERLGQKRRQAWRLLLDSLKTGIRANQELIGGLILLGTLAYLWIQLQ